VKGGDHHPDGLSAVVQSKGRPRLGSSDEGGRGVAFRVVVLLAVDAGQILADMAFRIAATPGAQDLFTILVFKRP
jgi:hypothetical protein